MYAKFFADRRYHIIFGLSIDTIGWFVINSMFYINDLSKLILKEITNGISMHNVQNLNKYCE